MKSYGRYNSSWDTDRIRAMLTDASGKAVTRKADLCIYVGSDGEMALVPHVQYQIPNILVCGVSAPTDPDQKSSAGREDTQSRKEFWDNVEFVSYTIDEMVPRVYDLLTKGIIEYDGLTMEIGRTVKRALDDAVILANLRDTPCIMGYCIDDRVRIVPLSDRHMMHDPMAYVITRHAAWSVSDMHSHRSAQLYIINSERHTEWLSGHHSYMKADGSEGYIIKDMAVSIPFHVKRYGMFEPQTGMISLERAFEDAVKMPTKDGLLVVLDEIGNIGVQPKDGVRGMSYTESFAVHRDEFYDVNNTLIQHKIRAAARKAYVTLAKRQK